MNFSTTKMTFVQAMEALQNGNKVKLPEWKGLWFTMEPRGKIYVEKADGSVVDTPFLEDYKNREDWFVTDGCRNWSDIQPALDAGKRIRRKGWNGQGMFVFQQADSNIASKDLVEMVSLPEEVRNVLSLEGREIYFTSYYSLWTAQGYVSNGWLPNNIDIRASDWEIV